MTTTNMDLKELLKKTADPDFPREMIGFTAQRLMELEVETLTGAADGARDPDRLTHSNGYRAREWETRACASLPAAGCAASSWTISAAREGRKAAVSKVLTSTWPRSRVHFMRNLLARANRQGRRLAAAFIGIIFAPENAVCASCPDMRMTLAGLRGRAAECSCR